MLVKTPTNVKITMLNQRKTWRAEKGKKKNQNHCYGELCRPATKVFFSQNFIRVSILVAITVWTVWLILIGPNRAISNLIANWEAAVTMIFG